jgi:hypothetical protein
MLRCEAGTKKQTLGDVNSNDNVIRFQLKPELIEPRASSGLPLTLYFSQPLLAEPTKSETNQRKEHIGD